MIFISSRLFFEAPDGAFFVLLIKPRGHRRIRTFGTYSVRLFSRQVHSTALPYVHFNSRIRIGCDSMFDIYAKFDITRRRMASFCLIVSLFG